MTDLEALTAAMHASLESELDECPHYAYTGGPYNAEPYYMCSRMAERFLVSGWLAKHDKDRDLAIAASVTKSAEQFLATANQLRLEGEHEASARYYAYAAARTTIAYEIKTGQHL